VGELVGLDKSSVSVYSPYRMLNISKRYATGKKEEEMETQLGITEARKQLARIIDAVKYEGDKYIIVRHGQPAAAVVPMEVYRKWKRDRQELFDVIRKIQAANVGADPDQVMKEVLEAQQAVRHSSVE